MSRDFLSHVIRTYGGPLHGMIGSYLEQSVKLITCCRGKRQGFATVQFCSPQNVTQNLLHR